MMIVHMRMCIYSHPVAPRHLAESNATPISSRGRGWVGHRLLVETDINVDGALGLAASHQIVDEVHYRLLHGVAGVQDATVHVHPDRAEEPHPATAHHRAVQGVGCRETSREGTLKSPCSGLRLSGSAC